MANKINSVSLSAIDKLRLRLHYIFAAGALLTIAVIFIFPAKDAVITFPVVSSAVFIILLAHAYAIQTGARKLGYWVENLVFASGLMVWALVWLNGEPATILLPAVLAFVGVFAFDRRGLLITYSSGSFVVMLVALFVRDLDPAVAGRSIVTLIAVIALLFFLRGYIKQLDSTNRELNLLQETFKGVLQAAKIDVFDERVSDGKGRFLHAHHDPDVEFVGVQQRLMQVEPQFREQLSRNLAQLNVPTEFRFKFDATAEDEDFRWYRQQSVYEYSDGQGELHRIGFSQMIEDEISSRAELIQQQAFIQAEIAKFDSLCNQLDLIFWRLNLSDWTLTYNAQFAKRWGLEVGSWIDFDTLKAWMHPDYIDFHSTAIDLVISKKEPYRDRYQAPEGPRERHWFELSYWPEFDAQEQLIAVNVVNLDITDTVRIEEVLRNNNAELSRRQTREKNMYAVIAHELRTPAAILKMQVEQEARGLVQIDRTLFANSVDQLLGVVDTLRTVSQPDHIASNELSTALIGELVEGQLAILDTLARDAGITLSSDYGQLKNLPVLVMVGPLKQLISNLIKNAIVHSGGSQVRLGVESSVEDNQRKLLTLKVDDDGCGIPAKQIDRLFEAYERGEGKASGTGLGLYICREIAKLMGGDLSYQPSTLGGACFLLKFSVDLALETPDEVVASTGVGSLKGMSILLVEDDPGILQMTAVLLNDECAVLRIAKNGKQALEILNKSKVDLILTDIFMPEMSGIEFTTAMRQQGFAQPVIGLTAATLGHETEELLNAGANAVLNKPVKISELQRVLDQVDG